MYNKCVYWKYTNYTIVQLYYNVQLLYYTVIIIFKLYKYAIRLELEFIEVSIQNNYIYIIFSFETYRIIEFESNLSTYLISVTSVLI